MQQSRRALIIETGPWHSQTIYPQFEFLRAHHYHITLIVRPDFEDLETFRKMQDIHVKVMNLNGSWKSAIELWFYLFFSRFDFITVNTVNLSATKYILVFLLHMNRTRLVVHDVRDVLDREGITGWRRSIAQAFTSRCSRLFLLNEKLLPQARAVWSRVIMEEGIILLPGLCIGWFACPDGFRRASRRCEFCDCRHGAKR